jgi:hypothetical protein
VRGQTRIRQATLLHPGRTPLEKLTLAVLERTRGRISLRGLAHELPARNRAVYEAVRSLERGGFLTVHRPTKRQASSHRWTRPNRYEGMYDTGDDDRGVWLPSRQTFNPGNNAARWILYALHLREQMIAGAVQTPNDVLAHLAGKGVSADAVRLARADWKQRGALVAASTKPLVYAVQSDRYPADLDRFRPNTSRKHQITGGIRVYGTTKQANWIRSVLAELEPEDAADATSELRSAGYILASDVLEDGFLYRWRQRKSDPTAHAQPRKSDPTAHGSQRITTTESVASLLASLAAGGCAARRDDQQQTISVLPQGPVLSGPIERHGSDGGPARASAGDLSDDLGRLISSGPSPDEPQAQPDQPLPDDALIEGLHYDLARYD